MEPKSIEKKIERISKQQKQKLVDYMATNLKFARGQFGGINGNTRSKEQWKTLSVTLNSLGGSEKSVEQWKKCWIDLKGSVKKIISARRKFMNATGGDSWADVPRDLNALEEQVLKIITVDAVDGDSCTPESGIKIEEEFVEYLDCDEIVAPPNKKSKTTTPSTKQSTSFKALQQNKNMMTNSSSKCINALDEARTMQKAVQEQLNRIEQQNCEIIEKLDRILGNN